MWLRRMLNSQMPARLTASAYRDASSFEKVDEKAVDVNIKLYESTRAELIQRIILRDGALLFYIATVGTFLNQAVTYDFSDQPRNLSFTKALVMMAPLPVVCMVFSLIILQHHMTIGKMGSFLRSEMNWGPLRSRISTHWDNSSTFLTQANLLIRLRLFGQGLILTLPLLYIFVFVHRFWGAALIKGSVATACLIGLAFFDVICSVFIAWLHVYVHQGRKSEWVIRS